MSLKNKNIIITGAGRGIGRETSLSLANKGANLVLLSRTEAELKETFELIAACSTNSFVIPTDVSDELSVEKSFSLIQKKIDRIDVLINNAGVQSPIGPFHSAEVRSWKKNIEINLFGAIHCTHAVLPSMIKNGKGKIINFSGGGAVSPRQNFSAYGAAKTAIVRFTETIAEELKSYSIDVNAVAPGAINTKMFNEILDAKNLAGDEYVQALSKKSNEFNDVNDVLDLIGFLVSEDSNGITGKLISAPWDSWRDEKFQEQLRTDRDIGTLRRIDNKYFMKKI